MAGREPHSNMRDNPLTGGPADRHPAESYEDVLDRDTRPVPAFLRQQPRWDEGSDSIPASRFYDPDYFRKEVQHVWMRVWQWACREEDLATVGDYRLYEIARKSLIVVRTAPGTIKAFYNSCLHRGRKLVTMNGSKREFRCPFHGFTWNCDGSLKENPIAWDFPHWSGQSMALPEVKVETWGGFVFINFDQNARPLLHFIGPLADHFTRYDYSNRYVSVHVQKVIAANWKITAEAFMESHHSLTTHPQILPWLADANSQYDILNDYVSRQFSALGVPSPHVQPRPSEAEIVATLNIDRGALGPPVDSDTAIRLPDGATARSFTADQMRKTMQEATGRDFSLVSDAELVDSLLYNVFPHMSFWAGYAPTFTYRWRPLGIDPQRSIMDILILSPLPKDGKRPASAATIYLGEDDSFMEAEHVLKLGAHIFQQDLGNLRYVQEGLHASGTGELHYGRYTEGRIRLMHHMIQKYIDDGECRVAAPATACQEP
jgi:nitrite reductase/ring-hydroxylating ferredoxin subunit